MSFWVYFELGRHTFLSPTNVACSLCPALLHRLQQARAVITFVIFIFAGWHSAFDDFGAEPKLWSRVQVCSRDAHGLEHLSGCIPLITPKCSSLVLSLAFLHGLVDLSDILLLSNPKASSRRGLQGGRWKFRRIPTCTYFRVYRSSCGLWNWIFDHVGAKLGLLDLPSNRLRIPHGENQKK